MTKSGVACVNMFIVFSCFGLLSCIELSIFCVVWLCLLIR